MKILPTLVLTLALVVGPIVGEASAVGDATGAKRIPRITNFIVLVDHSEAMSGKNRVVDKTKASLVEDLLLELGRRVPVLGYSAALRTFGARLTTIGPMEYENRFFKEALGMVAAAKSQAEDTVSLGEAILGLADVLERLQGKTAVVIISDDKPDHKFDAVKAARKVGGKYGPMCFHAISVADMDGDQATLEAISDLGNCAFALATDLLADKTLMEDFLGDVFYFEIEEEDLLPIPDDAETGGTEASKPLPATVYFGVGQTEMSPGWTAFLEPAVKALLNNPNIRVYIEGHTDKVGSMRHNQILSEKRARAIYDFFLNKGVNADQMDSVGYGETWPKMSNLTPEGRAMNRRVEISIE